MRSKRTIVYYLSILSVLVFAFFTNDFNLINVQKTAVVTAIAIDREDGDFSLTALVASPASEGSNSQGGQTAQAADGYATVSGTGGTIAEALENINAKTGWYPKLIFCRLLLLGEGICKGNVFDGLDYFLQNEYAADDCLLCATYGKASEFLSASPPLKTAVSEAIEKVLSDQPKQVGAVLTNTLRTFAISYFSAGNSGYMPLLKKAKEEGGEVFSASETALFINGKQVGKLDKASTFALACVKNPLRLASYTVEGMGQSNTLVVKNNRRKQKFSVNGNQPRMEITLTVFADLANRSQSQSLDGLSGRAQDGAIYTVAAERLQQQIEEAFAYCKSIEFDAFDAIGKLQKYENEHFDRLKDSLIKRLELSVSVDFKPIR